MEIIFVRHGESTQNVANNKCLAYDASNIILTKERNKLLKRENF